VDAIPVNASPYNQWRQIVLSHSGLIFNGKIYIDGASVPISNFGRLNQRNSFATIATTLRLKGGQGDFLDDIRIYNRALSSAEVGQLYQNEAGTLDTDGDGLTDAWERGYGRYQIVSGSFTWEQAKADAETRGGHLVTITSPVERAMLYGSFAELASGAIRPWLGGTDKDNEGNWRWITGETWEYTYWHPEEPNNYSNLQHYLWSGWGTASEQKWDDWYPTAESITPTEQGPNGYVLEFGYPTDPTKADTDGDGFNDSIEGHYASDPNNAVVTPNTIRSAGAVIAWGDNQMGQTNVPSSISTNAIQISSGYAHALALKQDGSVVAWGENLYGKSTLPGGLTNMVSVSAGAEHSVALLGSGRVRVWGDNRFGQTNVPAEALSGIVAVQAGQVHTLALTAMGKVLAWGSNESGQCTVPAEALAGIVAIGAGERHSIALTAAGKVIAWGAGQTNSGSYPNLGQSIVPAVALSGVDEISAYNCSNLILKDGQVLAWGDNYGGQVSPLPAESQSGVTQISLGLHHASALKSNGQVIAWGRNQYGQATPPIITQSGALAVSAGGGFTAAIVSRNSDLDVPVITLIGSNSMEIYKGTTFSDPGATVTDNVDSARSITGTGTVNTATVGIYTVTYTATDAAGNLALPVERTVNVVLDPAADEDGDGLSNGGEISGGTNPYQKDSDGDGVNDPVEIADGTNPNNASSYNSLNKGLVAYYPFNGNINDESGSGNHLSNRGTSLTQNKEGTADRALRIRPGQYVINPDMTFRLSGAGNYTFSFWYRAESLLNTYGMIFTMGSEAEGHYADISNLRFGYSTNRDESQRFNFDVGAGANGDNFQSDFSPSLGQWVHLAVTVTSAGEIWKP
jgi:alpha-tubulin suppressor-like RCC1 family protein